MLERELSADVAVRAVPLEPHSAQPDTELAHDFLLDASSVLNTSMVI
jgi:hypothetical protein